MSTVYGLPNGPIAYMEGDSAWVQIATIRSNMENRIGRENMHMEGLLNS
jgi:hypothetical protein